MTLCNVGKMHLALCNLSEAYARFSEIAVLGHECKSREMIISGTQSQATCLTRYRATRKEKKEAVKMLERVRFLRTGKVLNIRHWQDDSKSIVLAGKEPDSDVKNPRHLEVIGIANIATNNRRGRAIGLKKLEGAYEMHTKLDDANGQLRVLQKRSNVLWDYRDVDGGGGGGREILRVCKQVAEMSWDTP